MNNILHEGERLDDLERNNCHIIQDPEGFCFGMDAVLLSGFAKVKKNENVLDLGCGGGIIPILLEAKTQGRHFTGLEIQEKSADMARRSVMFNGQQDKIDIVTGDIKRASDIFGRSSFDVVVSNPPYMTENHGILNPNSARAVARHEILCTLEDVIREGSMVLKPNGRFYMVHRPFRLVDIIELFVRYSMEPKVLKMVHPYVDKEPAMVLIEAVKGGKRRLTVEKPVIIYDDDGEYTGEIRTVYGY